MGNDLSIKPRDKSHSDLQSNKMKQMMNVTKESTSPNKNLIDKTKNSFYIEKRRRFRELVSLQLIKRKPLQYDILKTFHSYKEIESKKLIEYTKLQNKKENELNTYSNKSNIIKNDGLENFKTLDFDTQGNNDVPFQCMCVLSDKNNSKPMSLLEAEKEILFEENQSKCNNNYRCKCNNLVHNTNRLSNEGKSKENSDKNNDNKNKSNTECSEDKKDDEDNIDSPNLLGNLPNNTPNKKKITTKSTISTKSQSDTNPYIYKKTVDPGAYIRNKFYTKLIANNAFGKSKQDQICQNMFIFDWDDTIMCTTYITPTGYFTEKHLRELEMKKDPEIFKKLEDLIIKVLSFAIEQGDTYIITNAASGWVEYSTRMFFPNVLPLLSKIIIISARGWFEKEFPRNSKLWKLSCFEELAKIQNKHKITNLIVLGDSLIEMEAAYVLAKQLDKCYVKTIKLKDAPSPSQLVKQLNLLHSDLHKIVKIHATMAISVQKQKKGPYSRSSSKMIGSRSRNRLSNINNNKIVTRDLQRFSII